MNGSNPIRALSRGILMLLGVMFLATGVLKAADPYPARAALGAMAAEFAEPGDFTRARLNLVMVLVVAGEVMLGGLLLFNIKPAVVAATTVGVLCLFTLFLWGLLRLPEVPACGCAGGWSSGIEDGRAEARFGVARNIGLAVLAAWAGFHQRAGFTDSDTERAASGTPVPRSARGFTMVELMVTMVVIAVLITITMPVLASAREAAKDARHLSNTRQLLVALTAYASDSTDRFPAVLDRSDPDTDAMGRPLAFATLAPDSYLTRNTLYWTDPLYSSGHGLPTETFFGPPDDLNPIRRTHYLLTGAAFAEPDLFVDAPRNDRSGLRVQRLTRTRFPSGKGYLLVTHSDVWSPDRQDLDPVLAGMGDGSASTRSPDPASLADPSGRAMGITWPVIWTRRGLEGTDF